MFLTKRKGLPPGPPALHTLQHVLRFRRDSLAFLTQLARAYGDIVHFSLGPYPVLLLNHPTYIREVLSVQHENFSKGRPLEMAKALLGDGLLTSEGSFHKHQSRLIQPAFHRSMIQSYAEQMTDCTVRYVDRWQPGQTLDILDEMVRLSTLIAAKTLFQADVSGEVGEINRALQTASSLFGRAAVPFSEWMLRLPLPSTFRFRRAKARLDRFVCGIIEERRRHPGGKEDLLSILLAAQEAGEGQPAMSDQQVRNEALTLFLTAFDTTSLALTWAWYLLSENPAAERALHEEVDRVLGGRAPGVEDIPQLTYTRMVLGESMRLYPPIYLITREAKKDFRLAGFVIHRGTTILMSPYLIHRDPRFHPHPERFDPLAWGEREKGRNAKYTYFPFSRGPRACIGASYAWMEGVLVLAAMAQRWRLGLVPDHPIELQQLVNLRPKHGMLMITERRRSG